MLHEPPPHPGIPEGSTITIGVEVRHYNSETELVYVVGPSGCIFSPAAEIKLSYADLDLADDEIPSIYQINDNETYVLENICEYDFKNKMITVKINQFTRYSIM